MAILFPGCPDTNFSHEPNETKLHMLGDFGAWTLGWLCLFYVCYFAAPPLVRRWLPPANCEIEDGRMWVAWNAYTFLQSLIIPTACVLILFHPSFGAVFHEPPRNAFANHDLVARVGHAFTCFEIADLIVMCVHDFRANAFVAHHAIFITLGVLFRGNCCFNFHAAILMAQEMSNPALNLAAFLTNRLVDGYGLRIVQGLRLVFALNFFVFRVGLNTYGTWHFFTYAAFAPPYVPRSHLLIIKGALLASTALQFGWAYKIAAIAAAGKSIRGETTKIKAELLRGVHRRRKKAR